MALIAKDNGGNFELAPAGVHAAVCTRVIDLGLQLSPMYGKALHKIMIGFEISEKMSDGRPFLISARYTLSLGIKATLRKDLESWRGRAFTKEELDGFDLAKVLGAPCMLNIVHSEDGKYSNIKSIIPMPRGMPAIKPVGELLYFSIADWDDAVFNKLSDKLREKILNRELPEEEQPAMQQRSDNGPFGGMANTWDASTSPGHATASVPQSARPKTPQAIIEENLDDDIPF